jgi:hypothetical protein
VTQVRASVETVTVSPAVRVAELRSAARRGQDALWRLIEQVHQKQALVTTDAGLNRRELRVPVPDHIRFGWDPDVARSIEHAVNTAGVLTWR